MTANRKLQAEIDRTLKRVVEGIQEFNEIWEKVHDCNPNLKEKHEADLKRVIKKLQRYRDQIKTWAASNDIKIKKPLLDARKDIETEMERFKALEKESKTKAYSTQGLARTASAKKDRTADPRYETYQWIDRTRAKLKSQLANLEKQMESFHTKGKGKSRMSQSEFKQLQHWSERHQHHLEQLKLTKKRLKDELVTIDMVEELQDVLEVYMDEHLEEGFLEDLDCYTGLDEAATEEEEKRGYPLQDYFSSDDEGTPTGSDFEDEEEEEEEEERPARSSRNRPTSREEKKDPGAAAVGASPTAAAINSAVLSAALPPPKPAPKAPAPAVSPTPPPAKTPSPVALPQAAGKKETPVPSPTKWKTGAVAAAVLPPSAAGAAAAGRGSAAPAKGKTSAPTAAAAVLAGAKPKTPGSAVTLPKPGEGGATLASLLKAKEEPKRVAPAPAAAVTSPAASPPASTAAVAAAPAATTPTTASAAQQQRTPAQIAAHQAMVEAQKQAQTREMEKVQAQQSAESKRRSKGEQPKAPTAASIVAASAPAAAPAPAPATAAEPPSTAPAAAAPAPSPNATPLALAPTASAPAPATAASLPLPATAPAPAAAPAAATAASQPSPAAAGPPQPSSEQLALAAAAAAAGGISPITAAAIMGAPVPVPDEYISNLRAIDASFAALPESVDTERPKVYVPRNPHRTPACFPSTPQPVFDDPAMVEKFSTDTLFFIFYFQQGTPQQYLAARELKKQSWRYHKDFLTWFQRHEDPKFTTDEYEQGTYVYFDYDSGWCQRIKSDFTFEYRHLEDVVAGGE